MDVAGQVRRRAERASDAGAGIVRLAERANLTATGVVALAMIVVGWAAARWQGSRTLYLMVYAAVLAIALAWVVTRRRPAVTVVRSDLPRRMRVGQLVRVELNILAGRRLSSLLLDEAVPLTLGRPVRIPISVLRAGETLEHAYTLTPSLRGVYTVGPVTASWSDPFGFTLHRRVIPEPAEIVVHPPIETVHDRILTRMWEDPPIRPPISKPWPVGFEFYGMRDYVPGDDLRRVVWPVLAKTGRMMVRESEQGITDRVVILLDTDRQWHSPGAVSETFEAAVRAVASLGVRHVKDGFSVTIITNDGILMDGARGVRAELPLLDTLAAVELSDRPIAAGMQALGEQAATQPHVLVVSPHLSTVDAQRLRLLTARGIGVVFLQLVWEEGDLSSAVRAAAVGVRVMRLQPGDSLEAVFDQQAHARAAR